jgi:pyruvate/2-oxoglutarate dehydrogenase complex dihydrolipoamide dehydrogenase (E3) component
VTSEPIENVVLGGGEALVGGSCPNIACLPSKNVIRTAKVADLVSHAATYGIHAGDVRVDMEGVRHRKRDMVDGTIAIHRKRFDLPHLAFLLGEGRLVAPKIVEVRLTAGGTRTFAAERLFLNLGTLTAVPDVSGLAAATPLTHVEALELGRLPSHLIILGGGYVGVELAQAFRRLGSKVTVLQKASSSLARIMTSRMRCARSSKRMASRSSPEPRQWRSRAARARAFGCA